MGDIGLENIKKHSGKTRKSKTRDSQCDSLPPIDPDLAKVIAAWPSLPAPIRRAILALIG